MRGDKGWRKGIADHESYCLLTMHHVESIAIREPLKDGRFAKRDGSILRRMKKASFRRIVATTRYCRSHVVPRHAPINISKAIASLVAFKLILRRKIFPA